MGGGGGWGGLTLNLAYLSSMGGRGSVVVVLRGEGEAAQSPEGGNNTPPRLVVALWVVLW